MLSRYFEDLKFHLERSPFSENILLGGIASGSIIDNGAAASLEFEFVYDGADAGTPSADYTTVVVPLDEEGRAVLRGIFDESAVKEDKNYATRRRPRVILFGWPRGTPAGTPIYVRGKRFEVTSYEIDANMGIVVWLR